jgi:predicted lipid-binding transport protein (Tim44 family)
MRTFFIFMASIVVSVMATVVIIEHADARRLGGGRSFGGKSTFSAPYKRITPSRQTAQPVTPAQQKNAQLRQSFANRGGLMGMLGGLALGGLLGALFFGGAFENINFLDILLFAGIAFLLYKFFAARRRSVVRQTKVASGSAGVRATQGGYDDPVHQAASATAKGTVPQPHGFDTDLLFKKNKSGPGGSAQSPDYRPTLEAERPAGFNEPEFMAGARRAYQQFQQAWDHGDLTRIRTLTTDGVYREIERQFNERHGDNRTEILKLNAELLEIQAVKGRWETAVLFDAYLRETDESSGSSQQPQKVQEVWHFVRQADSDTPTWYLDGIQQMEE